MFWIWYGGGQGLCGLKLLGYGEGFLIFAANENMGFKQIRLSRVRSNLGYFW